MGRWWGLGVDAHIMRACGGVAWRGGRGRCISGAIRLDTAWTSDRNGSLEAIHPGPRRAALRHITNLSLRSRLDGRSTGSALQGARVHALPDVTKDDLGLNRRNPSRYQSQAAFGCCPMSRTPAQTCRAPTAFRHSGGIYYVFLFFRGKRTSFHFRSSPSHVLRAAIFLSSPSTAVE